MLSLSNIALVMRYDVIDCGLHGLNLALQSLNLLTQLNLNPSRSLGWDPWVLAADDVRINEWCCAHGFTLLNS